MSNYRSEYLKKRIKVYTPEKPDEVRGYFDVPKYLGGPSKKLLTMKDLYLEKDLPDPAQMIGHSQRPDKPRNRDVANESLVSNSPHSG